MGRTEGQNNQKYMLSPLIVPLKSKRMKSLRIFQSNNEL